MIEYQGILRKAYSSDVGYDICALETKWVFPFLPRIFRTGVYLKQTKSWCMVCARSGLSFKHNIIPHPGIIDPGYRGEVLVKLYNLGLKPYLVHAGDYIAQLVFFNNFPISLHQVNQLLPGNCLRGFRGFGSSGK